MTCVQNIDNKRFVGSSLSVKEAFHWFRVVLISISSLTDGVKLIGHAILLDWRGDLMIRGLTCSFAPEERWRVVARFRG